MMKYLPLILVFACILGCRSNNTSEPTVEQFEPTVESLQKYECPEWFRDAKFGIWAHYGVQCAPEMGDWYANKMYQQYNKRDLTPGTIYNYHLENGI